MRLRFYLPYILVALAAVIAGAVAAYFNLHQRQAVAVSGPMTTVTVLRPGRALPDFSLQGMDGKAFNRASLTGHWSLLYFGYTHCPDLCPTTLAALTKTVAKLHDLPAASQPQVVFISVDPARDTPAVLRQYVGYFDVDFDAATGAISQLKRLTQALGVDFSYDPPTKTSSYAVNHSGAVLVIDPSGRESAIFTPPLIPTHVADDYRFLLRIQASQ